MCTFPDDLHKYTHTQKYKNVSVHAFFYTSKMRSYYTCCFEHVFLYFTISRHFSMLVNIQAYLILLCFVDTVFSSTSKQDPSRAKRLQPTEGSDDG